MLPACMRPMHLSRQSGEAVRARTYTAQAGEGVLQQTYVLSVCTGLYFLKSADAMMCLPQEGRRAVGVETTAA